MRTSTEQLGEVLRGGSFQATLTADVFYGADRRMQDLPIDTWSFTGDLDAEVKTSGRLDVVYQGDFADSLTPHEFSDTLAPFGQIVQPYLTIRAGNFKERIPLGAYRIMKPEGYDQHLNRGDRQLVVGSTVKLTLLDKFHGVRKAKFRSLEQPKDLGSAWAELARVTRLPVTRTVPDVPIPSTLVYDRSRLEAAQLLAAVLGGRAVMLADATVGVVPDTPGVVVADLQIGEGGVILDVGNSMSSDEIPNVVYGDFEDAAGNPIHVEASITYGALAVDGPYGENVVEFPSDQKQLYKSRDTCQAAVEAYLAKVSAPTTYDVEVSTLLDPRLELGDVVTVQRVDRILTGRVKKYTFGQDAPMSLTLEVFLDEPA